MYMYLLVRIDNYKRFHVLLFYGHGDGTYDEAIGSRLFIKMDELVCR